MRNYGLPTNLEADQCYQGASSGYAVIYVPSNFLIAKK